MNYKGVTEINTKVNDKMEKEWSARAALNTYVRKCVMCRICPKCGEPLGLVDGEGVVVDDWLGEKESAECVGCGWRNIEDRDSI